MVDDRPCATQLGPILGERTNALTRAPTSASVTTSEAWISAPRRPSAHRLGLTHLTVKHHLANARSKAGVATMVQLVWILAARLPEPEGEVPADEVAPS